MLLARVCEAVLFAEQVLLNQMQIINTILVRGEFGQIYQASPKFIAPIHSGLTLTAAEGESRRCLASKDFGGGAGSIVIKSDT